MHFLIILLIILVIVWLIVDEIWHTAKNDQEEKWL